MMAHRGNTCYLSAPNIAASFRCLSRYSTSSCHITIQAQLMNDDNSRIRLETEESSLDLNLLKELGRNSLVNALNSVNGAKTLVLDPSIAGPLGLLTEVALLKHHGVEKMFWLEEGPLVSTTTNVAYLIRPKIGLVKIIADQVKRHLNEGKKHNYTIFLVPRSSTVVNRVLEEEGVLGEVNLSTFNLQFIPLAEDVISLENELAFKEIWVDGDETVVHDSAQALLTFQKLYGTFPRIVGKGDCAGRLAGLLARKEEAITNAGNITGVPNTIDSLVVLDRRVDMITPMLTQLTYEGLIDEMLGIKNSHVEVPASLLSPPNVQNPSAPNSNTPSAANLVKETKKKYHLNASADPVFTELRDLNFSAVGKVLNRTARRLDEDYKSRHQAETVAQLKAFVGKLGHLQTDHQALRIHTGLTEMLVPWTRTDHFNKQLEIQQNLLSSYEFSTQVQAIEDLIAQGASMQMISRLLCLATITSGGIKTKVLENLKREFLQAYGYEYLPLLLTLSNLGLLLPNPLPPPIASQPGVKFPYTSLRKTLRLYTEEANEDEDPTDISYVYSGYAPLSARLVQCVVQKGSVLASSSSGSEGADASKKGKAAASGAASKVRAHPILGWKGFEDIVETIPGETVDVFTRSVSSRTREPLFSSAASGNQPPEKSSTSVVFFLGGCTYTEIAALRWVSRHNTGRRIVIATTGIISGSSLIDTIAGGSGTLLKKPAAPS